MLENEAESATAAGTAQVKKPARTTRRAASRPAGPPPEVEEAAAPVVPALETAPAAPVRKPKVTRTTRTRKKVVPVEPAEESTTGSAAEPAALATGTASTAGTEAAPAAGTAPEAAPAAGTATEAGTATGRKAGRGSARSGTAASAAGGASEDAASARGGKDAAEAAPESAAEPAADKPAARSRTRRRTAAAAPAVEAVAAPAEPETETAPETAQEPQAERPAARTRSRRRAVAPAGPPPEPPAEDTAPAPAEPVAAPADGTPAEPDTEEGETGVPAGIPSVTFQPPMVVFQPPQPTASTPRTEREAVAVEETAETAEPAATAEEAAEDDESAERSGRRRRRRGGRGRGKSGKDGAADEGGDEPAEAEQPAPEKAKKETKKEAVAPAAEAEAEDDDEQGDGEGTGSRRRRRRRRRAGAEDAVAADEPNTVVHVRDARTVEDEVQSVRGSTRLEAKKQRRREGREQGRRRPPVITEAEFLARRESVERTMVVRQEGERTQIAVLEDDVLVEHYVNRATNQSYVGNVYLGKVQNVLPSMEAAFVDIGKGRNAVLYAGEVNWDASGLEGQPRRIEVALKSGQSVLVQVTKDPMGHKGARLTSQISLPGRYLVYVPDGSMTGISRKLPDKERARLKQILKKIMPEHAGVIVRTAAEGATEEELSRDVARLSAQWENIRKQQKTASAPSLLHGEPDLTVRVIRDIFNEDFAKLVVAGDGAWDTVSEYVHYVAPHLQDRVERWEGGRDAFAAYRVDEQIAKALERKVWLPSGGSLVIDRTEAMTVIDVNTGKFTGQGGNLEETVTRNNLEAAEEIVRQLRLRDIGGIIVVDFIDMVLESNRDLVLRRLVECLSRDRTKHQVAEVTSLGLVQMTRKRVGQGLLEAFSETCECCNGRGIHLQPTPVESKDAKAQGNSGTKEPGGRRRKRKGDVEKAVEDKLARQDAARAADDDDDDTDESDPQAVVEAAEAAAESATAAPGALTADEPVETEESEPAATAGRRRRTRRTKKDEPAE
ncbi:Ribonuclease G [Actinomadura rubteroloni]|uniref:Ribonuclease E n=1 Tax=Actinomadura rubteroloni TaxID=1926885 RepID=A0A2P4US09_9ACTN|nr:Rne/Rng family ribonuclease [Actinomadura rubteroloni]POM27837.1 Ribonuclease G [Actinomadura rubteroloni]